MTDSSRNDQRDSVPRKQRTSHSSARETRARCRGPGSQAASEIEKPERKIVPKGRPEEQKQAENESRQEKSENREVYRTEEAAIAKGAPRAAHEANASQGSKRRNSRAEHNRAGRPPQEEDRPAERRASRTQRKRSGEDAHRRRKSRERQNDWHKEREA